MQINIEHITPATAARYLQANVNNRGLRIKRVRYYADQMVRGQWRETGDPIRFSPSGRLLDGQHRLAAIIAADVTIKAVIIRDVPEESFAVLDSGLGRKPADSLSAGRVGDASNKAATIRQLLVLETGGDPRKTEDLTAINRIDIATYYADHVEELEDAVAPARRMYAAFAGGNRAAWTAFCVLANRRSTEDTNDFLNGVLTGNNLNVGDPRLALRNWLANGRKLPMAGHYLGLFIKCWNDYVAGNTRVNITMRDTEAFPKMSK